MNIGDNVLWSGPDYDFPGILEEIYPQHTDGFTYARIKNHEGTFSTVRHDQLKPHNSPTTFSINGTEDLIKNGSGKISVINNSTNKEVPFKSFAVSIEDKMATVGFINRADNLAENKGAGIAAYKLLGDSLASQGIGLESSTTLQAPGLKLWNKLFDEGRAEKAGKGFRYVTEKQAQINASTSYIGDQGLNLIHGSNNPNLDIHGIEVIRNNGGAKQGSKYGGFYLSPESDIAHAEQYANMKAGTPTIYEASIKPNTKVFNKTGDITRLSTKYINEMVAQGYGIISGTDPRGRKEHVVINKDSIHSFNKKAESLSPADILTKQLEEYQASKNIPPPIIQPPVPPITPPPVTNHSNPSNDVFKNLLGFDVETTGVNTKTARMWQMGLSRDGGVGTELHTNDVFDTLNPANTTAAEYVDKLRTANGRFSQNAFEKGNFKGAEADHARGALLSTDSAINQIFKSINTPSILVLQNHNFENEIFKSARANGLISDETHELIQSKMENIAANAESGSKIVDYFQTPIAVQEHMRNADFLFETSFKQNKSDAVFSSYVEHLNKAVDSYKEAIFDPNRKGTIVPELIDITKTAYGNAAERGLMSKNTATLGLNVEFLAEMVLDEHESHTSVSDADQATRIFKKWMPIIDELRSGNISKETREIFEKINAHQPDELNKVFFKSLESRVSDFKSEEGVTKIRNESNYYQPKVTVHNQTSGKIESLEQRSIGRGGGTTANFEEGMNMVLDQYSRFPNKVKGVDRKAIVETLVAQRESGASHDAILDTINTMKSAHATNVPNKHDMVIPNMVDTTSKEERVMFFGKEMNAGTKSKIKIAAAVGLGYMFLKPSHKQRPQDLSANQPVFENFYDQQYLGSSFVDFKDRNKRYVM